MEKADPIPPCMIFVSNEGKWYHEGAEIIHRPIFLWLIQSLEKTEEGLFIVHLNNQKCVLEVEDTPLVIQRVDLLPENSGKFNKIQLTLNDESKENLDPETLSLSPENILYCTVKMGQFPARFLRPAYYQIAEYMDEDGTGGFVLLLNQMRYPIRQKDQ
jgi:uncharacterized protein